MWGRVIPIQAIHNGSVAWFNRLLFHKLVCDRRLGTECAWQSIEKRIHTSTKDITYILMNGHYHRHRDESHTQEMACTFWWQPPKCRQTKRLGCVGERVQSKMAPRFHIIHSALIAWLWAIVLTAVWYLSKAYFGLGWGWGCVNAEMTLCSSDLLALCIKDYVSLVQRQK